MSKDRVQSRDRSRSRSRESIGKQSAFVQTLKRRTHRRKENESKRGRTEKNRELKQEPNMKESMDSDENSTNEKFSRETASNGEKRPGKQSSVQEAQEQQPQQPEESSVLSLPSSSSKTATDGSMIKETRKGSTSYPGCTEKKYSGELNPGIASTTRGGGSKLKHLRDGNNKLQTQLKALKEQVHSQQDKIDELQVDHDRLSNSLRIRAEAQRKDIANLAAMEQEKEEWKCKYHILKRLLGLNRQILDHVDTIDTASNPFSLELFLPQLSTAGLGARKTGDATHLSSNATELQPVAKVLSEIDTRSMTAQYQNQSHFSNKSISDVASRDGDRDRDSQHSNKSSFCASDESSLIERRNLDETAFASVSENTPSNANIARASVTLNRGRQDNDESKISSSEVCLGFGIDERPNAGDEERNGGSPFLTNAMYDGSLLTKGAGDTNDQIAQMDISVAENPVMRNSKDYLEGEKGLTCARKKSKKDIPHVTGVGIHSAPNNDSFTVTNGRANDTDVSETNSLGAIEISDIADNSHQRAGPNGAKYSKPKKDQIIGGKTDTPEKKTTDRVCMNRSSMRAPDSVTGNILDGDVSEHETDPKAVRASHNVSFWNKSNDDGWLDKNKKTSTNAQSTLLGFVTIQSKKKTIHTSERPSLQNKTAPDERPCGSLSSRKRQCSASPSTNRKTVDKRSRRTIQHKKQGIESDYSGGVFMFTDAEKEAKDIGRWKLVDAGYQLGSSQVQSSVVCTGIETLDTQDDQSSTKNCSSGCPYSTYSERPRTSDGQVNPATDESSSTPRHQKQQPNRVSLSATKNVPSPISNIENTGIATIPKTAGASDSSILSLEGRNPYSGAHQKTNQKLEYKQIIEKGSDPHVSHAGKANAIELPTTAANPDTQGSETQWEKLRAHSSEAAKGDADISIKQDAHIEQGTHLKQDTQGSKTRCEPRSARDSSAVSKLPSNSAIKQDTQGSETQWEPNYGESPAQPQEGNNKVTVYDDTQGSETQWDLANTREQSQVRSKQARDNKADDTQACENQIPHEECAAEAKKKYSKTATQASFDYDTQMTNTQWYLEGAMAAAGKENTTARTVFAKLQKNDKKSSLPSKPLDDQTGWISNKQPKAFLKELDEACKTTPGGDKACSNSVPKNTGGWLITRSKRSANLEDLGSDDDFLEGNNDSDPGYKYYESRRGKGRCDNKNCFDCEQCRQFYEWLEYQGIETGVKEFFKENTIKSSRHKGHTKRTDTPEDFWELSFIDERNAEKVDDLTSLGSVKEHDKDEDRTNETNIQEVTVEPAVDSSVSPLEVCSGGGELDKLEIDELEKGVDVSNKGRAVDDSETQI